MPQNWIRMNREESNGILDKLGDHRDEVIFSRDLTEVSWRTLPFYGRYKLYRLVNYATMPVFSMTYLSDGTEFVALDGTANPIYETNDRDPIRLNEMNVIPYLDFFFGNVQGSEGDVFLIKDPRKMAFMGSLSENQQRSVISTFKPLKVARDEASQTYKVSGTIYYGGGLIASTIAIAHDGKLAFEEQSLLLSGIHFPPTPYSQAWLEG